MGLKDTIRQHMYSAMKEKRQEDKSCYSMMLDTILKVEKEKKKELTDDEVVVLLQKQIKQCNETLEYAKKNNSEDIIKSTENEIALLTVFLPKMLTEEEINMFLDGVFEEIEPIKNNKGRIMKECSKLRGKADMKLVAQLVDKVLT